MLCPNPEFIPVCTGAAPECQHPELPPGARGAGVIAWCAELEAPALRQTARRILEADAARSVFVTKPPVERSYTFNDAVAAAQALREISTGYEAAAATLGAAGLDGLGNDGLEDVYPITASRPTP